MTTPSTRLDRGVAAPVDESARAAACGRLAALATPAGALGRLGDLAVWLAATRGELSAVVEGVRCVVFAGDHGVAAYGASAYPSSVTAAMVRTVAAGTAGISVLARQHQVPVRVLDLGVDADLADLGPEVVAHKVGRGSAAIHLSDALSPDDVRRSLAAGAEVATHEIAAGAQLLVAGDLGIGNTTAASALVGRSLGLAAAEVTGRGTGLDDAGLRRKTEIVRLALARVGGRDRDPVDELAALGGADLAAAAGFYATAARAGVPVLLDGLISAAAALFADRLAPGAAAWFAAGHRSTEPAQWAALEALGLTPVLDLGLRLGEGSGALTALPVLRSAALLLAETALLSEVLPR